MESLIADIERSGERLEDNRGGSLGLADSSFSNLQVSKGGLPSSFNGSTKAEPGAIATGIQAGHTFSLARTLTSLSQNTHQP
jgi:hypothetical protein